MPSSTKLTETKELAQQIKSFGYRVFLAKSGTYGIFCNQEGTKVISFDNDLTFNFGGNYKSEFNSDGTGWKIYANPFPISQKTIDRIFNSTPSREGIKLNGNYTLTNLEHHLKTYASSEYTEIK